MKALHYTTYRGPITLEEVPDPSPAPGGVVIKVESTGLCRSDWHGWCGHDPDITLPHVPGHEWAGVIEAVGSDVRRFKPGDRVTAPFVCGCGVCPQCAKGDQHICDHQFQPGFTHWGSFAEYVGIHYADANLVLLPETISFETAASLGCRFATSFRAVIDQGRVQAGEWVVVFGCGGVGLSAVMIAATAGAHVIAVDVDDAPLSLAQSLGATHILNTKNEDNAPEAIRTLSNGGVHLSIEAIGHARACYDGVASLRKRGRHVQVGLLAGEHSDPRLPMARVIADELEIIGSHGLQAWRYDAMLGMVFSGAYQPDKLIAKKIDLAAAGPALMSMDRPATECANAAGVTIITPSI